MNSSTFNEKDELSNIKRLYTLAGLLVLYSFLVVIGYTFQGTVVLYLSEIYFVFLLLISFPSLYFFKDFVRAEGKTFAELIFLLVLIFMNVVVLIFSSLFSSFISPDFLISFLKLIELALYGLIIVDISETWNLQKKVQRYNFLLILGAFLLSIKLPTTLFAGLLFFGFGFAGISTLLRRGYIIVLRTYTIKK